MRQYHSPLHLASINVAIIVDIIQREHGPQLVLGRPIGGQVHNHQEVPEVHCSIVVLVKLTECFLLELISLARTKHLPAELSELLRRQVAFKPTEKLTSMF